MVLKIHFNLINFFRAHFLLKCHPNLHKYYKFNCRNNANFKFRHCLISGCLISGGCLIDQAHARSNHAAAWSIRLLPDQNQAAAWSIRHMPDQNQAAAWSIRLLPDQNQAAAWLIRTLVCEKSRVKRGGFSEWLSKQKGLFFNDVMRQKGGWAATWPVRQLPDQSGGRLIFIFSDFLQYTL